MKKIKEKILEDRGAGLTTSNMDHHGIIAAICKNLKIASKIDKRLLTSTSRKVSPGQ